ncbi:MAG: ShlB/FhaC/HecB family hemolysin secretion/activation protein [bacterium]
MIKLKITTAPIVFSLMLIMILVSAYYSFSIAQTESAPAPAILPEIIVPESDESNTLSSLPSVFVRKFTFIGNTVFSAQELSLLTKPYTNRHITFEELQELRRTITRYYIDNGYINSGAVIPDQRVENGHIAIKIIEGMVKDITIEGNRYYRSRYFTDRLFLAALPVVNVNTIQKTLQHLEQDPLIKYIKAELKPGIMPGESILHVNVKEENPYRIGFEISNTLSPSVGALRGALQFAHKNLTENGDAFETQLGYAEGINDFTIGYMAPLTKRDTSLTLQFNKSDSTIIEDIYKDLDIESKSESYTMTLGSPCMRMTGNELYLKFITEFRKSETFLLGQPFSFSDGGENGTTKITVLRFSQEWINRSHVHVLSIHFTLNWGIDAFGATVNDSGVDGKFVSWRGQVQMIKRLEFFESILSFRADTQLSEDSLVPLEKYPIGGMNSVRGYRQNQCVGDNGLIASLELRIPLFSNNKSRPSLNLVPFCDFGRSWNTAHDTSHTYPDYIMSVGVGFTWVPVKNINCQIYTGFPLRDVHTSGSDLQDKGIHFCIKGELL